jgi:shikimate kinase
MNLKEKLSTELNLIHQKLDRPIVLIGMMGAGKSRLGSNLADLLDLEFFDADRVIESKAGRSVSEIFAQDGEAKFRAVENKTMHELAAKPPCIIASGGGAPAGENIMGMLKDKTVSVWLRAEMNEILRRLESAKDRPLLKQGNPEDILRGLLEKRTPFYAQADIAIDAVSGSFNGTLCALIKGLYAYMKPDKF